MPPRVFLAALFIVHLIHQVLLPNSLERLKVVFPRSADFISAFSVFNVALHLFVARKQTEILLEEAFVFQLHIGFDDPFQVELVVVDGIVVGIFHQVLTSAALTFQEGLGGSAGAFGREGIAAAHVGMAIDLERRFRAASHTDIRAFKETKGRIEVHRLPVGQVGRRLHGHFIDGIAIIAFDRDDGEVAGDAVLQPAFTVHHLGVFTDGHAVDDGHLVHPNKRVVFRLEDWAVNIEAIGIGAVEDDDGEMVFGSGLHHVGHCGNVGIKTYANILKVEEDDVDALQHLGRGLFVFPEERDDGEAGFLVFAIVDSGSSIGSAAESMLGCVDFFYVDA